MADDRAARLAEAKAAKHAILTGKAVRKFIDQNGESVEYAASNLDALDSYIAQLECGVAGGSNFRRPIGFIF